MSAELESVIARIKKLSVRTTDRGCTEAEALAAIDMIGHLMKVYGLSIDKVWLDSATCRTVDYNTQRRRHHPMSSTMLAIAKFTDCRCWTAHTNGSHIVYRFFGFEPDTDMALYLIDTIIRAADAEAERYKQTAEYRQSRSRKSASVSFLHGMADRIAGRLYDMAEQRKREQPEPIQDAAAPSPGALIVLKNDKFNEQFRQLGLNLRTTKRSRTTRHGGAYAAGTTAGERVNLNRPIGGGATLRLN